MEVFKKLLEAAKLTGAKTYIAGLGMVCLGVYQLTEGEMETGTRTITEGLAVIGIRAAIGKLEG